VLSQEFQHVLGDRARALAGHHTWCVLGHTDRREGLLAGADGAVYLEKDVEERDRYGRLLRWVWFEADGRPYLANEAITRAGFAERYRDTPNRRYVDDVIAAEAFAREHALEMWGACD